MLPLRGEQQATEIPLAKAYVSFTGIDSFKEWFKGREEQYDILEKSG